MLLLDYSTGSLEDTHAAVEAAVVEARRRVRMNEER